MTARRFNLSGSTLDLSGQALSEADVGELADVLKENMSIQTLRLSNCQINDVGFWQK